jgi:site-specific DNA recombinase
MMYIPGSISLREAIYMVTTLERPPVVGSIPNGHRNGHIPLTGKAAIYIRVSGRRQEDGASLEVQLETCRRYCEANGLEVVAEFQDVQSGLDIDRPQYQQALKLAINKGFDKLVVWRYDRSGRDDAEYFGMLKDFAKLGIQLVSASGESPDPFYQKLAGVLAWDESRRISIRVTSVKMKRFKEGKWSGKPVFGYQIEKHPTGGKYLVPKPGEAELVQEIFAMYASGHASLLDLRNHLNRQGILKSRYGINYVLRNRVYLGEVPHGRCVDSQFHAKPESVTWTAGTHQPLVDTATFDRVQQRLSKNQHRQWGGPSPRYLFSGLVICGNCGHKFAGRTSDRGRGGKSWSWYQCGRRTSHGDCQSHTVSESRIRDMVIPPIEALLGKLNQEDIRAAVREELSRQDKATIQGTLQAKESLAEKQQRLENRLSNLEDDYLDRTIPKERYLAKRDEIMAQLAEIKKQLEAKPHLALPDLEQFFALADSITIINGVLTIDGEPLSDQAWREFIEGMVDWVVIEGHEIRVIWKPSYEPLLNLVAEG